MKINDRIKNEIINKYKTGNYSCTELSSQYEIHLSTVCRILKKAGINIIQGHSNNIKYTVNHNYLDKIDTEEKAYFLGFFYADGYNNESRNYIAISLQERDKSIIEKFKKLLESDKPLYFVDFKTKNKNSQNHYKLQINSKRLSERLKELGCPQRKSLILEFPTEEQVPSSLLKHFIRGMLDGDGCFSIVMQKEKYKAWQVDIMSTLKFCLKLKEILEQKLCINSCVVIKKNGNPLSARIYIGGRKQVAKLLNWIYQDATIYLERKYNKYIEEKKDLNAVVKMGRKPNLK